MSTTSPAPSVTDEAAQLTSIEDALARQFDGRVDRDRIRQEVRRGVEHFKDAKVRTFVPVLIQREAAQSLRLASR